MHEQMVHQCMSEDLWFRNMLGIDVHAPPLPEHETSIEFMKRYAEDSGNRLARLRQTDERWWEELTTFFDVERSRAWVMTRRLTHTSHHRGQQMAMLRMLGRDLHSNYGPTADTGGLMQNHAPTDHQAAEGRLRANLQAARRTRGGATVAHDGACQQQHHRRRTVCRSQRKRRPAIFLRRPHAGAHLSTDAARGLRVIAVDPSDAPSRHRAAMALHGSVRRSNDAARVAVHLVDTESGSYLWSDLDHRADRRQRSAQDRISKAIVDGLQPDRLHRGVIAWGQKPIDNLAAAGLLPAGTLSPERTHRGGTGQSRRVFRESHRRGSAICRGAQRSVGCVPALAHYGVLGPADVWTKAASSAATGVLLDGNSAEARTSLAHMKSTQDWDWRSAEREFQRAITLDPKYRDCASLVRHLVPRADGPA